MQLPSFLLAFGGSPLSADVSHENFLSSVNLSLSIRVVAGPLGIREPEMDSATERHRGQLTPGFGTSRGDGALDKGGGFDCGNES